MEGRDKINCWERCRIFGGLKGYVRHRSQREKWTTRVEGGVEYLHRDPVSPRRRQKGKSQIWDSKIWSLVPRNTALARASSIYKRQTRPLVREGAPQKQDRGAWHQDLQTDWPSVAKWLWLWLGEVKSRVETGSNTSTVVLLVVRGDEKGSLESERVKYDRECHGTRTREWLRWREPAAIVNDRPVLSSERAPQINKSATVWQ
jgi:hypothetical protein